MSTVTGRWYCMRCKRRRSVLRGQNRTEAELRHRCANPMSCELRYEPESAALGPARVHADRQVRRLR